MRIRLSDLAPGINYAFQLRSNTGSEVSDWSRVFNILTASDTVPPKTPVNVVETMSGTTFNLSWDVVTESTDNTAANDLDHYEVLVESTGTVTTGTYAVTDNKFQFTLDANRLLFGSPRANIKMSARAVDKVGNASLYSAVQSQTNPAPANPTGFTGASVPDGLTFKWTGVADTDLLTYRLYSGTTAGSQTTLEWSGLATSTTLQSIAYGVDKWFKVAAVDVFGTESVTPPVTGPLRPASPFTVDTTAPSVPTGLAATLTNETDGKTAKAVVTWTAVTDTANDLSEYIIGYKPSSETDWQYTKVDYTNTSTTIKGLLPYVNYDFRIRASDWAANLSAWSTTVTKTATANTAPATVTGVTVTAGTDSVTVKWTANTEPDVANGAGVYLVDIATNSAFTTGLLSYRTGEASISVNGLTVGTTYYARVKAVDSLGLASAAWSTTASATTGNFPVQTSSVIIQDAAPGPEYRNVNTLWIDTTGGANTPKRWVSGTTWAVVTDKVATDAAAAVDNLTNTVIPDLTTKVNAAVKSYVNEYAVNSSETVAPTTGWSTATPTRTPGTFIWFRTVITYTDNTTDTTAPALLTGNTGATGSQGIQGPPGSDGTSLYTWLKYADTPTTGMSDLPTGKTYMGLAYNKTSPTESSVYSDYAWSLIKGTDGVQGPPGTDGQTTYTWVKYATSAAGAGLNDSPVGMTYIGLAFNKTTATESTVATDYQWSLIQGPQGTAGTPAATISLTATSQVLTSPATGGATNPTTSTVTGTPINTTITAWTYSVDGAAFSATVPAGVSRTGNVVTVTGSTMTARTIAVRMADAAGVADTLTVAKVSDGATGATGGTGGTGPAGADAYTVILTNEAQVFAGSTSAALAGSATTSVIAYKGTTQMPATIGTVTGQVTGLTTAITNNGTNNATVTVTVTTSLTTPSGTLTIPVTVDGKSFTKTFSWSVSFAGATGSTGGTGATGVGITSVTPYYQQTSDVASAPALPTASPPPAPWTSTEPAYAPNTALWRTERVLYTNSTFAYTAVTKVSSYAAAAVAQQTADGKNKIIYSTSNATGTTGFVEGDTWRKVSTLGAGGKITGEWTFVSGAWQTKVYSGLVLTELDAGSITTGFLDVANRIQAGSLVIGQIASLQSSLDAAVPKVTTTSVGTGKVYTNPFSLSYSGATLPGTIAIETPINFGNYMTRVSIEGYNYQSGAVDISLDVSFYAYSGSNGIYVNYSATSSGACPVTVRLAKKGSDTTAGTVVILIDRKDGSAWAYPKLNVTNVIIGQTLPPDAWVSGWTAPSLPLTDISAYFRLTTVPMRDFDDTNSLAQTWRYTGTTEINGGNIRTDTIDVIKLKAGSTFTQDLNVASTFTLGNSTTDGIIKSYGYTDVGTSGFKLSKTGLVIKGTGNVVDASVLKGGTITGTTINVGAGGVLNVDSTASIKSNNYSAGLTGYSLGSTGLEVNDGSVNAKVITSGTISTATLTLSGANGKIVGTGFSLAGTGLVITSGSVAAAALQIQQGQNLIPPPYADFEFVPKYYDNLATTGTVTKTIVSTGAKFNGQYLSIRSTIAAAQAAYMGLSTTDYNIPVEAGLTYIVSAWVKTGAVATSTALQVKYSNATMSATLGTTTLPANGAWQRISGTVTIPAGVTAMEVIGYGATATIGAGFDIDGIQVEVKEGSLTTPSTWTPPSATSVDGGYIRTGEIRSTSNVLVNGVTQPAWSINMSGNAQFGDALVRGKIIVGTSGSLQLAPADGTFESGAITSYFVYDGTATATALTQTFTVGEVITGGVSGKATATPIADNDLGVWFNIGPVPYGSTIRVQAKVMGDMAGADINIGIAPSTDPTNMNEVKTLYTFIRALTPTGIDTLFTTGEPFDGGRIYIWLTGAGTSMFVVDDITVTTDTEMGQSAIMSGNFAEAIQGWKIDSSGNVEFNNGFFRGVLKSTTLIGDNIVGGRIIAGPENGTHAEMTASGFRVFVEDTLDGIPNEVIRMGVSDTNDMFAISDAAGLSVASIDETGGGNFSALNAGGTGPVYDVDGNLVSGVTIYGDEFRSLFDAMPKGNIALGYRTDTNAYSSTEAPYLQVDFHTEAGRLYRVTAIGYMQNDSSSGRPLARLRWRTDGSAAQTSSDQRVSFRGSAPTASLAQKFHVVDFIAPGDRDVSYLLTVAPESAGNARFLAGATDPIFINVEDIGIYVADVGIDRTGGTPPPTKKNYTTTWTSTSSATYQGDGDKRTDTSDVVQGQDPSGYNGNGEGIWIFPSALSSTLAGSTVTKVEVYAYANHWYNNSGGTALIKVHGYTSAPGTNPTQTTATSSSGWPKPGGRWVTLPSSFNAGFAAGTYKGFGMGPGNTTSLTYYGRFNGGTGAKIRVSYTK